MTNEQEKKDDQEKIQDEKELKISEDMSEDISEDSSIAKISIEDSADKKPDEEPSIETAKSFNELYDIVKKVEEVIGSDGTDYEANDLIDRIDELREGLEKIQEKDGIKKLKALTHEAVKELIGADENLKMLMRQITRAEGLRNKVIKLAIDEVITREVSRGISEKTKHT